MTSQVKRKTKETINLERLDGIYIMGVLDALSVGNDTNTGDRARKISQRIWKQVK